MRFFSVMFFIFFFLQSTTSRATPYEAQMGLEVLDAYQKATDNILQEEQEDKEQARLEREEKEENRRAGVLLAQKIAKMAEKKTNSDTPEAYQSTSSSNSSTNSNSTSNNSSDKCTNEYGNRGWIINGICQTNSQ